MKLADLDSIQKRLDKKNKKNSSVNELNILETALKLINKNEFGILLIILEKKRLINRSTLYKTCIVCLQC